MTDQILKLADQVFRLVFVVRNIAYHRSLYKYKDEFEQNYWILIFNNFLDIAALEWCKVFGSKSNLTHWSKHIKNQDEFRSNMLIHLNLSQEEWEEYWKSIKDYRDCMVAHHIHNPEIENFPDFNIALLSCYFYYEIIIKELRLLKVYDYPDSLEEYYMLSLKQAENFSCTAYTSTLKIKDNVY